MYITINNIKGEKRIDLSYSIQNFDSTARWGEVNKEHLGALPGPLQGPWVPPPWKLQLSEC